MKIILISLLSLILSTSIFARLNPFEPTDVFLKEKFEVLPFVKIYVLNDMITIKVNPKYRLLDKNILIPKNKIVFDFEGNISFYTIRKNIFNDDFNSFTIGTHREDNFFRVVIDLPSERTNYIENINNKNGIITIKKK
jgi:hypothetical protein